MSTNQPSPSENDAENVAAAATPTDDATDVEGFAWFAKYDGIDGSARSAGHEKWIEITSAQLSQGQAGLPTIGGLGTNP